MAALREAAKTPRFKPVTVERRDLFQRPMLARELAKLDAVPAYGKLRAQAERAGNESSAIALKPQEPLQNPLGPGPGRKPGAI